MSARVGHEYGWTPEAHRLMVEQRRIERYRVVILEPRRLVDQYRKCGGMAFRERIATERAKLTEYFVGKALRYLVMLCAVDKGCTKACNIRFGVFTERTTQ